jgi:hypothetical protein
MPRALDTLWNRVYADFLMPSRLGSYRRLLESILLADYQVTSIERFWDLIRAGAVPDRRYLILRHDIDTDPRTAAAMWSIEHSMGIESSYYFRLSTIDIGLMRAIGDAGGEASYHYEEIATLAKRRHLRNREDVLRVITGAQAEFRDNLDRLRAASGLPMRVVASHGDFVNRKLGITNTALLADPQFRLTAGVELETYDYAFMRFVSRRYSDTHHPQYWIPEDPRSAIGTREPIVYLLVHPRHWQIRRSTNAQDDLRRLWEGLLYDLPAMKRSTEGSSLGR